MSPALLFVQLIHIFLVFCVLYAPFSGDKRLMTVHALLIPFLFFHWLLNNDTCALTEIEKLLRNTKDNSKTIFGSIFGPLYKIDEYHLYSRDVKILSAILWIITLTKLKAEYSL